MQESLVSLNNKMKNLQHFLWDITRLFLVFCWFTLDMKDYGIIMCLNGILKTQILQKICIFSRPLFIIFNHLFHCLKVNFGPLHWQEASLIYSMLIIVLYLKWWKGIWEPRSKVRSQSPAEHISRVRTENLHIWSWSVNPLCIL